MVKKVLKIGLGTGMGLKRVRANPFPDGLPISPRMALHSKLAIKVNVAAPGHVATDFSAFIGKRTPAERASIEHNGLST